MSTNTIYIPKADALPAEVIAPEKAAKGGDALSPLARLTSETAFSFLLPKLQAAFESLHQPGSSMLDILAGNINELQDCFTQALYAELSGLEVDFSIKITLRLNRKAQLALVGEHPDQGAISAMLAGKPELSIAFAEIAAQSAALRDLRSLSTIMLQNDAAGSYTALAAAPGENTYQLSLKGDMNHFYFTRS